MRITPAKLVLWSLFTAAVLFGADFVFTLARSHRGPALLAGMPMGLASAMCLYMFARRWKRLRALRAA